LENKKKKKTILRGNNVNNTSYQVDNNDSDDNDDKDDKMNGNKDSELVKLTFLEECIGNSSLRHQKKSNHIIILDIKYPVFQNMRKSPYRISIHSVMEIIEDIYNAKSSVNDAQKTATKEEKEELDDDPHTIELARYNLKLDIIDKKLRCFAKYKPKDLQTKVEKFCADFSAKCSTASSS